MAWGLEARVPFLDKAFLEVAMNIKPEEKMFKKGGDQAVDNDGKPKMEKVVSDLSINERMILMLRSSISSVKRLTAHLMEKSVFSKSRTPFSYSPVQPYLPRSILWRQKEQFSDGVGYSWIDG